MQRYDVSIGMQQSGSIGTLVLLMSGFFDKSVRFYNWHGDDMIH